MKHFILILTFGFLITIGCNFNQKKEVELVQEIIPNAELIEKGKSIAMISFGALSAELQKAMIEGGVPNAISYCNVAAMPLTDSLSRANNAIIKRTSLKYRNPNNKPTEAEAAQLHAYQKGLDNKESLKPIVKSIDQSNVFYAPIIMQDMCLKCHGETKDITEYDIIKKSYPDDLAVNYQTGDLRGMWSISFLK